MPLLQGTKPCDVCGAVAIRTEKTERPLICSECWGDLDGEQPNGVERFKETWNELFDTTK